MSLPRIFVHIPAYRDRETQWTLRDMFERARHPERVFAGVCWQVVPEEDADCFAIRPRPAQVRSVTFHAREARGLGWARGHAQALWQGEEYSLQIDSHMRFAQDWDVRMLTMLAQCDAPDPVLTHYPAAYTPPDAREDYRGPWAQCVHKFLPNGMLEFTVRDVPAGVSAERPFPTAGCAGGFIFGSARILRDVPADPEIYFTGEEPSLAVRLWTHGFELFSPQETLIYHYYLRKDGARHWNDAPPRETHDYTAATLHRMALLCEPARFAAEEVAALGRFGLGAARSLAAYEAFAGVNFIGKTIAIEARAYPWVRTAETRATLALPDTLRPAPGTELFILGEEGLLFAPKAGQIFRLNQAATRAWCALEAGQGWAAIAGDAAAARGIAAEDALAELREIAAHWLGHGLLADMPPPAPDPSGPRLDPARYDFRARFYRLGESTIRLRYGDAATEGWVHPALAHLEVAHLEVAQLEVAGAAAAGTITAINILDWHYIFAGERILHYGDDRARLVPILKTEMMARAARRQPHILHLHAGVVQHGGRTVLLPARSGSGKTLLTARLLAAGCTYFSDEAALLAPRGGEVRPMPTALSVKAGGVALLAPHYPGLADLPEHLREDGLRVRYLPPPAASLPPPGSAARADAVVFRRFVDGAPTRLRRLGAADAFGRLVGDCLAIPKPLDLDSVATLVDAVERMDCWELTGGDLDAAAREVMAILGG